MPTITTCFDASSIFAYNVEKNNMCIKNVGLSIFHQLIRYSGSASPGCTVVTTQTYHGNNFPLFLSHIFGLSCHQDMFM